MSFKNRFVILSSGFLIFAAVSTAPAAQATQEKNNQQIQQDRTNNTNRKQWSKQHTSSTKQVRQVQTALKNRGFDPGSIDGVMGPKTMMAVRNFQSSQGMTASGMIDEPTLVALEIQSKPATGSTSSSQTSSNVGNSRLPQQGNQPPEALPRAEAPSDIGVGPTAFDREDVRQAQMALKNRGYDPGELNGMISSQTQDAIRQFQMANGLSVNGKLDQPTQAALGITIKGTSQDERIAKPGGPSAESEPQDTSKYDKTSKLDKDAQERLEKSASVLQDLTGAEDKRIPDGLLERAQAVVVIPHMVKGAFGIGGRYGKGVVSERLPNGRWSSPAFIQIGGGSFGLQLGASATDLVLVFTDKKALDLLEKGKDLKLGVDAGVVAGPIGRQAEAGVNANLKTAIYAYSRAKGLFAGVALDGAVLDIDDSMNIKVYGPNITAKDILDGRVQMTSPDPFTAALDRIVPKKKISER
jgi:lipid-binding SYLF domain-containing protein